MEQVIKIQISNIDAYYKVKEKILLEHYYNIKSNFPTLIIFIIGAFLLIDGLSNGYDVKSIKFNNGQEDVTFINYGIFIGIGCGLLLTSILRFVDILKSKKSTKILFRNERSKQINENTKFEFEITDEKIHFYTNLYNWTKKLEYYDFFKIENKLLKLYSNSLDSKYPELIVPIDSLKKEQKELLVTILNKKIKNYQ